jgi:hypothetical protein
LIIIKKVGMRASHIRVSQDIGFWRNEAGGEPSGSLSHGGAMIFSQVYSFSLTLVGMSRQGYGVHRFNSENQIKIS